jgi:hypothetical protein
LWQYALVFPSPMPTAPSPLALRSSKSERGDPKGNGRSLSSSPSLSPFASGCADFFDEAGRLFGLPPSVGRIYGLLYGSPKPLSFTDIVEQLEISKGSASQGLQFLNSLGAIRLASASGIPLPSADANPSHFHFPSHSDLPLHSQANASRRVAYEPELSLRRLVSGVLRERIAPMATEGDGRLDRLRKLAERDETADDFCLDRVKQLETWRRRLKTVLPMLSLLLGPKSRK